MNRRSRFPLRMSGVLAASLAAAGCMSESPGAMGLMPKRTPIAQIEQRDADVTGSIAARAGPARHQPSYAAQNPPPSAVEIRAQCWREFEAAAADLDTKTVLTQACVNKRTGR